MKKQLVGTLDTYTVVWIPTFHIKIENRDFFKAGLVCVLIHVTTEIFIPIIQLFCCVAYVFIALELYIDSII